MHRYLWNHQFTYTDAWRSSVIERGKVLASVVDRSHDVHCHWRNMRYLVGESEYRPAEGREYGRYTCGRDGCRREVFEKAGVDDRRSSWKIEVEEVGGKGVPSRLTIFHGVLVARKGFQRRTVLPEAVLQTRDKGSPVPRFRRRETAAAKTLIPLLHLSLATRECRGNRRKESREQTPFWLLRSVPFPSPSSTPAPLRYRKLG